MNLRKLECFLALAEELHFGKAAERLYMAQPPLSRTIKELEAELEVRLFTRNSRTVEITRSGLFLKDETKKLFSQVSQIKEQLKQIEQGKTGKLKIGYVGSAMHSVLPGILHELKKELDVNMILTEFKSEQEMDLIGAGQIHIGFLRNVPERNDLMATKVCTETFSLIMPLNHPLASRKKVDISNLAGEPFIGLNYECAPKLADAINEIFRKSGFTPKIAHETSQVNSIIRLVESNMGYSIVPTGVKKAYSLNVKFIELPQFRERAYLYLIHKKEMDPLVKRSIDIILDFIRHHQV